jgi:hypothetical protein
MRPACHNPFLLRHPAAAAATAGVTHAPHAAATAHVQVTAVLSVPLLDIALLVSLVPWSRRRFISQDLVFLESYKPVSGITHRYAAATGLVEQCFMFCAADLGLLESYKPVSGAAR